MINNVFRAFPRLILTSCKHKTSHPRSSASDRAAARLDALPAGHIRPVETADGKVRYVGKFIDQEIIDVIEARGGWNKAQIDTLRELSSALERGEGDEFLLHYFKATVRGGGRYLTVRGKWRTDVPVGITLTKDGNIIVNMMSLDQFNKNVDFLFTRRKNDIRKLWGTDEVAARENFEKDVHTYLRNHSENKPGADGIGVEKRDIINSLFGLTKKEQAERNPFLQTLPQEGKRKAVWRSLRLDRIPTRAYYLTASGSKMHLLSKWYQFNLF